jgi:hypothetical protein
MRKISDRNTVILFVGVYRATGEHASKMAITLEGRPSSTNPLTVFH